MSRSHLLAQLLSLCFAVHCFDAAQLLAQNANDPTPLMAPVDRPIDEESARQWQMEQTDRAALQEFALQADAAYRTAYEQALLQAAERDIPTQVKIADGSRAVLRSFTDRGFPVYFVSHNSNAAITTSTDAVQVGGLSGYNLIAPGLLIGVWDDGGVYTGHPQFGSYAGRNRAIQRDVPSVTTDHATHVAGTIGQVGLYNKRGMATVCYIDAYDWNNDISEMAAAFLGPMLVSNHSYDNLGGWHFNFLNDNRWVWFGDWTINTTTDYNFGFYDSYSQQLDQTAALAPFSLIVRSAGNDRNDTGPGGGIWYWIVNGSGFTPSTVNRNPDGGSTGYDCLMNGAVAKNVLTVGAVNDIVPKPACADPTAPGCVLQPSLIGITAFSSWGPTDDGRIKPDIVANGHEVSSAFYNTPGTSIPCFECYGIFSGTSQASPNVSGSLLLLQEHYQNLNSGQSMRAASLKGLAIHSADDAGSFAGPDYSFGYGLLNTHRAARVINDINLRHRLIEATLTQSQTQSIQIQTDGTRPLKTTLCWHDPAGTPVAPQLNPTTSMLVNDLDLVLINNAAGTVYQPWILNPSNPSAAATTGNNSRDNVEQVLIAAPPAGTYTLQVSHKGTLQGGSQPFSLWVSGMANYASPPYVTSFEFGLDQYWTTSSSNSNGRIITESAHAPHIGFQQLTMSANAAGTFVQNDADLRLNLAGMADVDLTFWWKSIGDEAHAGDGIWFSDNGGASYSLVYPLVGNMGQWQEITLDVDALAALNGRVLTSPFVVRFGQYDDDVLPNDGFAFDDVSVNVAKSFAPLPYSSGFEMGVTDQFWWRYSSNSYGYIQVEPNHGPSAGAFHLTMQNQSPALPTTQRAQVYLNLAGMTDVDLVFDWKAIAVTPLPTDGIYFSNDGGLSFVQVMGLSGNNGQWQTISLDMDRLAALNAVPFSSSYVVRFEQTSTMPLPAGGVALDNIIVTPGKSYAALPYYSGFESGLDQYWRTYQTDGYSRADIDMLNGPYAGTNQLLLHSNPTPPAVTTCDAQLFLDLGGQSDVDLSFWWKEFPDVDDAGDAIFFSQDGGLNFTQVFSLHSDATFWQHFTLDVDQLAAANALGLTSTFVIKFQHTGINSAPQDGFGFDEVLVTPGKVHAPPPYTTGFESGVDQNWQLYSSNSFGYIQSTGSYGPKTGNSHLVLGGTKDAQSVTNGANLYLDMTGVTTSSLSFAWKRLLDEAHNGDGVYFSDDSGLNFTKVYSLTSATTSWLTVTLNIITLASNNGLNLNSSFVIRFQQTDDEALPNDGIAIDDITISGPGSSVLVTAVRAPEAALRQQGWELLRIYPNPSNEQANIELYLRDEIHLGLDIFDPLGQLVSRIHDGCLKPGAYRFTWQRQDGQGEAVAAGNYYLRIRTPGGSFAYPIVVVDGK